MNTQPLATVPAVLRERVAAFGDVPCVVMDGHCVSYRELWDSACRLAAWLLDCGVVAGDRIALIVDNSPRYVATFYGAMLAGAVVVPMNTAAKSRDFRNWLEHSGSRLAFVDLKLRETHTLFGADLATRLVTVNDADEVPAALASSELITWEQLQVAAPTPQVGDRAPGDLACILYTSGTTGNPKGVMISHGNLLGNVNAILAALPIRAGDRFLNVLPFYYSYGNSVLHTHLLVGATLVLENSMMYPSRVVARLAQDGITGFGGVPSTFSLLMSRGGLADHDLSSLRYVLQAGGALPVAVTRQLVRQMSDRLYIMYGQTEATARITCLPPEKLAAKMGSVGQPVAGVEVQVRKPDGTLCDPWVVGELFVRGDNVACGYWQNLEATAATFVDGWLKTGDLGYLDAEGYVFLQGRRSDMIKSGANRISPGEIEEVIAELADIEEVAVAGYPDEILGQVIAAFLVMKQDCILDVRAVKKHCLDNLAAYKIPKRIIEMDALPKTASGKVKKHLLVEQIGERNEFENGTGTGNS